MKHAKPSSQLIWRIRKIKLEKKPLAGFVRNTKTVRAGDIRLKGGEARGKLPAARGRGQWYAQEVRR